MGLYRALRDVKISLSLMVLGSFCSRMMYILAPLHIILTSFLGVEQVQLYNIT